MLQEKEEERAEQREEYHELLTIHETAEMLGVDDTTVRRWCRAGVLQYISLPHLNRREGYRVRRDVLEHGMSTGVYRLPQQSETHTRG